MVIKHYIAFFCGRVCVYTCVYLCLCQSDDIWEWLWHRVYPRFCAAQGTMNCHPPRKLTVLHTCTGTHTHIHVRMHTHTHTHAQHSVCIQWERRKQICICTHVHTSRCDRQTDSLKIYKNKFASHTHVNTKEDKWIHTYMQHENTHTHSSPSIHFV